MIERACALFRVAIAVALLAGCAAQPPLLPQPLATGAAPLPETYYRILLASGTQVFHVDPERSLVTILVRRGGAFAQLGHDHVVSSRQVTGFVAPDAGMADLLAPLGDLAVDEPELRAAAGLGSPLDPADVEGTRLNMLRKVLDADAYPFASISVRGADPSGIAQPLRVSVSLHGITQYVDATTALLRTADEIEATGSFAIDQTEFGITPLAILGGAIAVQDRVYVAYRIRASRAH